MDINKLHGHQQVAWTSTSCMDMFCWNWTIQSGALFVTRPSFARIIHSEFLACSSQISSDSIHSRTKMCFSAWRVAPWLLSRGPQLQIACRRPASFTNTGNPPKGMTPDERKPQFQPRPGIFFVLRFYHATGRLWRLAVDIAEPTLTARHIWAQAKNCQFFGKLSIQNLSLKQIPFQIEFSSFTKYVGVSKK